MVEDEWHLKIAARVRAALEKKGLIADRENSERLYKKNYQRNISCYGLETVYGMFPAIATADLESGKLLICLNPYFAEYSPEFQMLVLIEEAMHIKQLRQLDGNFTPRQYLLGELEAANRLLKIKDYLKLSKFEVWRLEGSRGNYEQKLNAAS